MAAADSSLPTDALAVLEAAWTEPGFCVPHPEVYPHQWLWDSCFHSLAWLALDRPDRAVRELGTALGVVEPDHPAAATPGGLVPHMRYWHAPTVAEGFWGRPGISCLTQPPIFGHVVRVLHEAGVEVAPELVAAADRGLRSLLERRVRLDDGRVAVIHPWETGCDDSPRWDADADVASGRRFDREEWRARKTELVGEVVVDDDGAPVDGGWRRGSIGFNSLLVWNLRELATVTGDDVEPLVAPIVGAIRERWSAESTTWTDHDGPAGAIVTADACLGLLVDDRPECVEATVRLLTDPTRLGGPFGPAGVDRRDERFDPSTYWRGPVWPQLGYLLWRALAARGRSEAAAEVAAGTRRGASRSGWSEYWHPDTGEARGATPQTWATIVVAMD